jgi:hypothetical protein
MELLNPGSKNSNLELDADFHYLRARNLEICAWPLGVMMHEREYSSSRQRAKPERRPDGMIVS